LLRPDELPQPQQKKTSPCLKKQIAKGKLKKKKNSLKNPSSANTWLLPAQPGGLGGEGMGNGLGRRRRQLFPSTKEQVRGCQPSAFLHCESGLRKTRRLQK